ncbi:MAG TPA: hypothetical protein DDY77_02915 [Clostridiales bacterium]|nr:hypothetical protein [Clostridiales bacterium]
MDNVPSEMLRGHIDTIILLSLLDSDKHTGQIKEEIESRSDGQFELKQGTFYSCLQRIVKQGYVTEYRVSTPEGRKKFYQLTEKGKVYIDENKDRWCFSRRVIDTLIQVPEPKEDKQNKTVISLPDAPETAQEEEISPEDTLKQFLDGALDEQKKTETQAGSYSQNVAAAQNSDIKATENISTEAEKAEEKKKTETKNGGYDLFTYLDYTQSYPLDEASYKKQAQAKPQPVEAPAERETFFAPHDEPTPTQQTATVASATEQKQADPVAEQTQISFTDITTENGPQKTAEETAVKKERVATHAEQTHPQAQEQEVQKETAATTVSVQEKQEETEEKEDFYPEDKVASREYRTVLSKLFPEKKKQPETPAEEPRELVYTEGTDVNSFFHDTVTIDDEKLKEMQEQAKLKKKHKIEHQPVREQKIKEKPKNLPSDRAEKSCTTYNPYYDFSDIKSLAEAEGFRVRISSAENRKDSGRIMINKLIFHSSLIYFAILAIETLIIGLTTASIAKLSFLPYFIFGCVCALFPISYGIAYLVNPDKRVTSLATFKSAIELIIIITLNLCLVLFCCCIFAEIDFSDPAMLLRWVFYPLLILLNLPVYTFIKYLKLDNQRYFS